MEFAKLEKNWAEHQQAKTVLAKSSSQRSYFMVHVHVHVLVPVELQFYSCTTNDIPAIDSEEYFRTVFIDLVQTRSTNEWPRTD